tara:strand:- start:12634 stop:12849 length:216 start_codon:yes stop_codon:yes gene_type:complete
MHSPVREPGVEQPLDGTVGRITGAYGGHRIYKLVPRHDSVFRVSFIVFFHEVNHSGCEEHRSTGQEETYLG